MIEKPVKWPRLGWRLDPGAYQCWTCEFGSEPPAGCKPCKGCINRDSRPHWQPNSDYLKAAAEAIAKARGATDGVRAVDGGQHG